MSACKGTASPDLKHRMTVCDLTITPLRGHSAVLEDGTVKTLHSRGPKKPPTPKMGNQMSGLFSLPFLPNRENIIVPLPRSCLVWTLNPGCSSGGSSPEEHPRSSEKGKKADRPVGL